MNNRLTILQKFPLKYSSKIRKFCKEVLNKKYPDIKLGIGKSNWEILFPYITCSFLKTGNLKQIIKNQRNLELMNQDIMDFEKELFLKD